MKKVYFLILLGNIFLGQAQTFTPKVNNIPSSPEAAMLGRYGDIPVGYYTGTANISIPLFTVSEGGVEIPIALSYHSSGIKLADEATWVGLGWSLDPGGAIIQEVRGKRDQDDQLYWSPPYGASTTEYQTFKNNVILSTGNFYGKTQTGNAGKVPITTLSAALPGDDSGTIIMRLQEGHGQPDIYSYNFPGYSGKYYINPDTHLPVQIDKKEEIYFLPASNTIITDNGNKFHFDAQEYAHTMDITNISGVTNKITAVDVTNGQSIQFEYYDELYENRIERSSLVLNPSQAEPSANIYPTFKSDYQRGNKKTLKKITTREYIINFNLEGRDDIAQDIYSNAQRLKSIDVVSAITGKKIKSFVFSYTYFNPGGDYHSKRLKLDAVQEIGYDTAQQPDYSKPPHMFEYDMSITMPVKESLAADFYGYYNGKSSNTTQIPDLRYFNYNYNFAVPPYYVVPFYYQYNAANRYTDNYYAKAYMLKKLTYPTKGYTEFAFEPNSFSNQFIPDADKLSALSKTVTCATEGSYANTQTFTPGSTVVLRIQNSITHGNPTTASPNQSSNPANVISTIFYNAKVTLSKTVGGTTTVLKTWTPNSNGNTLSNFTSNNYLVNEEIKMPYEAGATYSVLSFFPPVGYTYSNNYIAQTYSSISYYDNSLTDTSTSNQCGMRVKTIKSYSAPAKLASYKKINYSDGRLLSQFSAIDAMTAMYSFTIPNTVPLQGDPPDCTTAFYMRYSISSDDFGVGGGTLVGYGKVEEVEVSTDTLNILGKKIYTFFNTDNLCRKGYPVLENVKNGRPIKEEVYDKIGTLLSDKNYFYTALAYNYPFYGIRLNSHSFGDTDWPSNIVATNNLTIGTFYYKYTFDVYPITTEWNLLDHIISNEYFNTTSISSTTSYTYNSNGKTQTVTSLLADGTQKSTKTYYPGEIPGAPASESQMITAKMTGIPVVSEEYRGSELLSQQTTEFAKDATTSNYILPKFVYSKKGNTAAIVTEKRANYDKYDAVGNLLQYTLENGKPVSIIWGYNNTLPIAKIENIAYSALPATALNDAVTASNTQTESQLLVKLETLRNDPALANAMMSSFTFIPGIGVSKMIQPNGNTVTYAYDSLGRLISAKDHNGNVLSTNEYHYKP